MKSYKIPLVSPWLELQLNAMSRFKTLSLPIFTAVVATTVMPASADLVFAASTTKSYRAGPSGLLFNGGTFDVNLRDGNFTYQGGCVRSAYWPPNIPRDPCPLGSTGFLLYGVLADEIDQGAYFSVISVVPALAIESRKPEFATLIAAPASKLVRPSKGFEDNSFAMYYNLHNGSAPEYVISIYNKSSSYSATQRSKFESEVVKGVYQYTFPRLKQPTIPAPLEATIFPMVEGIARLNNKTSGFDFDGVLKRKLILPANAEGLPAGFVELSSIKLNTLTWKGLTPSNVYTNVDKLYFSIRVMADDTDPAATLDLINNRVFSSPQAVFPPFLTGRNPRILLPSPYSTSFVVPPILEGGARGVAQLELDRSFYTGGVAYDFSNRKFEVPVIFVNRYRDYAEAKNILKANIVDDTDGDGVNNLNEWIQDSDARFSGSIPARITAQNVATRFEPNTFTIVDNQYFGFNIPIKLQTIPAVNYILQRSFNGGLTWNNFVSDSNWNVTVEEFPSGAFLENDPARSRIRVESKYTPSGALIIFPESEAQGRPPGTSNETYRVKITL